MQDSIFHSMGRSAQAFMAEQAAQVEPEVVLDDAQAWALQDERWAVLEDVERSIEEELHPAASCESAAAFASLSSLFN